MHNHVRCIARRVGDEARRSAPSPLMLTLFVVMVSMFAGAAEQRGFRMGFSTFAHDSTPEAWNDMSSFLGRNSDIVLHHIEGVAWTEALNGASFAPGMMQDWERRRTVSSGKKVYLAVSPLNFTRSGIALYRGEQENMPVPQQFRNKALNDPQVEKAYLNFCERSIDYFKPDYMAIGIEVNELFYNSPHEEWPAYVELHKYVYRELKRRHPDLPLFATMTVDSMLGVGRENNTAMLAAYQQLMDWNDVVAISFYPFFRALSGRVDETLAWLARNFDRYGKPYAVAETGEQGADTEFHVGKVAVHYAGSPELQASYYEKLLSFAQVKRTLFVIAFFYRDYGALIRRSRATSDSPLHVWRHNGLLDDDGNPRESYRVWKKYFDTPLSASPVKSVATRN